MINQVVLMGRLTGEPETRYIQGSNSSVTRFTLAVERDFKGQNEERAKTDFINCIAWNKTGEFIDKYFRKGSMLAVLGSIETGSYTNKDGNKVYTTDVNVTKASFTGERSDANGNAEKGSSRGSELPPASSDGFMDIPDDIDEELPFS